MTVNEIINRLKEMDKGVYLKIFDQFGQMYTSDFACISWRGAFDMPSIIVDATINVSDCTTVKEALVNLSECDGEKVEGYKGGEYILNADDTVYLSASYDVAGDSVTIKEIYDDGYCVLEKDQFY